MDTHFKRPDVDSLMDFILGVGWEDDDENDEFAEEIGNLCDSVFKTFCKYFGHSPIRDMCGKPEHDYCTYCMAALPGQGKT
jgi:hypothetical protein